MNKVLFALIFFALTPLLHSQNLDSLYSEFIRIKSGHTHSKLPGVASVEEDHKCGFGIVNAVKSRLGLFTADKQNTIKSFLSRPQTDTSFVTPSGKFRIHFNKKVVNALGYSLSELAKAADSSYNYEVNILGYPPPPSDFGEGGDNRYDIYVGNLASNLYGYTELEAPLDAGRWTSFMVIDNDYSAHYTQGINGARVTVAHELHHAIQMGNYIYREEDQYYHEITSTHMEELVYDSINDYYAYMKSYTNSPSSAFTSNNGYNLAVWNIFISERFGVDIIKKIWELMPQKRAMNAMAEVIAEKGSSFKNEFSIFGQWLFFTGPRAVPGKYFEEAVDYSQIKPLMIVNYLKPQTTIEVNSHPVSLNYLYITGGSSPKDTFVAIISNCDVANASGGSSAWLSFKYLLAERSSEGYRKIIDGYYSKIESANSFLLAEVNILNNFPLHEGNINTVEIDYVYPQPFRYSTDNFIYFPASGSGNRAADLNIYSADMDLVFSGTVRIFHSDKIVAQWNPQYNAGGKLATGVYIYVLKNGDEIKKGKFVIYND